MKAVPDTEGRKYVCAHHRPPDHAVSVVSYGYFPYLTHSFGYLLTFYFPDFLWIPLSINRYIFQDNMGKGEKGKRDKR